MQTMASEQRELADAVRVSWPRLRIRGEAPRVAARAQPSPETDEARP